MKSFREKLLNHGVTRLVVLSVTLIVFVLVILFGVRMATTPTFAPLYSGLSLAGSSQVVQALESAGFQVEIDAGGTVIRVPQSDLARARMALAEQGLPNQERTPEEIEQLEALVRTAVGLDPERGDSVTVQSLQFADYLASIEPPGQPSLTELMTQNFDLILRGLFALTLVLMALLLGVRPVLRSLFAKNGSVSATTSPVQAMMTAGLTSGYDDAAAGDHLAPVQGDLLRTDRRVAHARRQPRRELSRIMRGRMKNLTRLVFVISALLLGPQTGPAGAGQVRIEVGRIEMSVGAERGYGVISALQRHELVGTYRGRTPSYHAEIRGLAPRLRGGRVVVQDHQGGYMNGIMADVEDINALGLPVRIEGRYATPPAPSSWGRGRSAYRRIRCSGSTARSSRAARRR